MSSEAVALSMLFTATVTSFWLASGSAMRFVNWARFLPSLSRVTRPMIWIISVSEARYPTVRACSAKGQSNPSFAIPSAMIMSTASRCFEATVDGRYGVFARAF